MTQAAWNAEMNAKHGAFVLTRYSRAQCRYIAVGKVHRTIEAAQVAARLADKRFPDNMHFIDLASAYGKSA